MNKVPKVTFGCILAILVVVISGSYSMMYTPPASLGRF